MAALAALVLLWGVGASEGRPKRSKRPAAVALPATIAVKIVEGGQLTEVHVEGAHLRARSTAGGATMERTLEPAERARLAAAARAAVNTRDTRRTCAEQETFVTVTVDGKTNHSAVCPAMHSAFAAPWRTVLEAVRAPVRTADGGA